MFLQVALVLSALASLTDASSAQPGVYVPVSGGWQLSIPAQPSGIDPASTIGVVQGNARLHRRPLYPPADKTLLWNDAERAKMECCGFRPLVLAYNEPRFLFDYHGGGGLLGHLYLGLHPKDGEGKWLHQWANLQVAYIDGRMEYTLSDPAFPGLTVHLAAIALAQSDGLLVHIRVDGLAEGTSLTWAYGGASAFFTNYAMDSKEYTFTPAQCAKDRVSWDKESFALRRRFDKTDSVMEQAFAVPRYLPEWEAVVRGGSSFQVKSGFGKPEAFQVSPGALLASAEWANDQTEKPGGWVVVQDGGLPSGHAEGYVVVGMGGNIEHAVKHPKKAHEKALERNSEIAGRIVTKTSDPYLDAATTMMAFATDGTWGDSTIMHGAWSWRFGYLGWRGWYGPTCYGWTDRIKRCIENQTRLALIKKGDDAGAISSMLDSPGGVFYNMNEVFLDHVRQYFEYTNDTELMKSIFPVLKGVVEWENRRLQPGNQYLYENALNTWISDGHWYIQGQCTQASAYMLQAHRLLARLAPLAGEDPAPFSEHAARIAAAMQEKLWMPDEGVFAEYLDTRGAGMLHRQPELPTIYHAAEFGAANPYQIYQMLQWADINLKSENTPGGGKLVWSSNWVPNTARSYTHSTHEMAYGEELNFALTNYLAGRSDAAYALLRASFCGIFNGPTPGGLSCHTYIDGRQRANDEFADAISMWGRAVAEGLFGIRPNRPEGYVALSPQFPRSWNDASIKTPHFSYSCQRTESIVVIKWESPTETSVHLRYPTLSSTPPAATIDGRAVDLKLELTPGVTWVVIATPPARKGTIELSMSSQPAEWPVTLPIPPKAPIAAPPVWKAPSVPAHDLNLWNTIDCAALYSSTIPESLERVGKDATPPPSGASLVGFGYWKDYLTTRYHGGQNQQPNDEAWRAKVGPDGIAWTTDGIPFKTAKEGPNIAIITRAGVFPSQIEIPVHASGKNLYLMISGSTFPAQSHMTHLRVTLHYTGGSTSARELTTPDTLGDCWNTWCGRWHDTAANGFENLAGRFGPAGSSAAGDLTKPVNVDTEAHLVDFPLEAGKTLDSISVEAVANDIVFGVMGATILK